MATHGLGTEKFILERFLKIPGEWPQQTKKGSWREDSEDGELLTRYVLEGTGAVEIEEDGNTKSYNPSPQSSIFQD